MSAIAIRRARVLELKAHGASVEEIALALGIHPSAAQRHLKIALAEAHGDRLSREEARTLEILRMDLYLHRIEDKIRAGELGALDRAIRIAERRAAMLGLDDPKMSRVDLTQGIYADLTDTQLNARITMLRQMLDLQDPKGQHVIDVIPEFTTTDESGDDHDASYLD